LTWDAERWCFSASCPDFPLADFDAYWDAGVRALDQHDPQVELMPNQHHHLPGGRVF
jgi:cephalosporin-C deacetylase-like acetyl esterase